MSRRENRSLIYYRRDKSLIKNKKNFLKNLLARQEESIIPLLVDSAREFLGIEEEKRDWNGMGRVEKLGGHSGTPMPAPFCWGHNSGFPGWERRSRGDKQPPVSPRSLVRHRDRSAVGNIPISGIQGENIGMRPNPRGLLP